MGDWDVVSNQPTAAASPNAAPDAGGWNVVKQEAAEPPSAASRMWSSFVSALPHPIDAIQEWANRPSEIGKAMDGLHELNQMEKAARADPKNQGKPREQWVWPEATPQQQEKIAGAMSAQIGGSPEGNALTDMTAPAGKAAKQMASGDVAGGFGTLGGAYVAPAAVAAVAPGVAKGVSRAVEAAPEAAATTGRVVTAAAKAGGKDVAVGTAKIGAAAVLDQLPIPSEVKYGVGLPTAAGGAKQIGRGLKAAYQAGKAELTPVAEPYVPPGDFTSSPAATSPVTPNAEAPIPATGYHSASATGGWNVVSHEPYVPPGDFTSSPAATGPVTPNPEAPTPAAGYRTEGGTAAPTLLQNIDKALARAAAPTTTQPKTVIADVGAALPRSEPGEAAAPAATPPAPAAPAAPAAAAPPPPYGKQYITPGQVTKYAADNGLGEDDAAAALQKEGVSVVDRSSTNRVLHAIGSELGYDHGTLSEIAHATYGKGLGKITHEQMMELAEKLGNEQASKEPLATKRTGSPADPAIAPEAEGSPLGGVVAQLPTSEIHADPVRFQYKAGMGQGGAGEELRGVTTFDPEKSGILSVWKDPADGKTYVVNGHHRLELAQRTGAQSLTVRYIDAANAAEARAKGAMINIAEGRGTSIDAAKVFRDSGATAEDLQNQGLSLTGSVAKEGQALANLDPNLFNQVVSGEMKPARGAMIGQVAEHADQQQLVKLIQEREASGRPMTDGQVSELLRMQAPQVTETQHSLFGDDEISRSLIAEKAGVSDYVQSRLTQKRRTFNAVGNERAATRLAEAGNVIDADKNAQIAEATNQEHAVYQKLSTSTGPVADALDEAAKALHSGENPAIVKVKTYAKIEPILKAEADKLTGRSSASAERSEGSAQAGSGQAGRGKHNSPSAAQSAGKPAAVAEAADEDLEAPLRESLKKARVKKAAKISDLMGK